MYSALPIYQKQDEKTAAGKIFRPWDVNLEDTNEEKRSPLSRIHHIHQDSTVTTTTPKLAETIKEQIKIEAYEHSLSASSTPLDAMYATPTLPYLPFQAGDYLPGLSSTDIFLSQNYALEEYARVLSQDHQAKLLHSRKQRPKKYKCPHCDVGFSNNGQLKGHIRIHTGERPFKCEEKNCGKTFTRNEELTRHKRIHSGLRPFPCPQCGKRFGRKDHLKKHSRTHMQPRSGLYAVPVMLPLDTWAAASYPYMTPVPLLY